MPTQTYIPLANYTLTSNDSFVLFSNIPNTYKDLVIAFEGQGSIDENLVFTINGSTSGFSWVQMTSAPTTGYGTNTSIGRVSTSRTTSSIQFSDYAMTSKSKTFFVTTEVLASEIRFLTGLWSNSQAINSIGLGIRTGGSFLTGSQFRLFGIHG